MNIVTVYKNIFMVNLHYGKRNIVFPDFVREEDWFVRVKNKLKTIMIFFISVCIITAGNTVFANNDVRDETSYLIVCGMPVGIKLNSNGIVVTGFIGFIDENDEYVSPAKQAGLKEGDRIISIDGKSIKTMDDLHDILLNCGERITVKVENDSGQKDYILKLCKDKETGELKIGIWAKDTIAGIGTLTYYNPEDNTFGALGHAITEENRICKISGGKLYEAQITGIKKGQPGCPGELHGYFKENKEPFGKVLDNKITGIFGEISEKPSENKSFCKMQIGKRENVQTGKAYIMSSAITGEMEKFSIDITQINEQNEEGIKCFDIEVKDKKLIEATGGIVQGMSGSPIIQNGRIVGAVTHVLVNNPTRGYGIFIENMLDVAG